MRSNGLRRAALAALLGALQRPVLGIYLDFTGFPKEVNACLGDEPGNVYSGFKHVLLYHGW